jgi:hypothetical protein
VSMRSSVSGQDPEFETEFYVYRSTNDGSIAVLVDAKWFSKAGALALADAIREVAQSEDPS